MILNADATYKIAIFGEGGVGKTTLTQRYLTGIFRLDTQLTMGAEIFIKYLDIKGKRVVMQIWDFGGEERFRFLLPTYAHGSNGGIFMFDTSRYSTLIKLEGWLEVFREGLDESNMEIPVLLVGGKADLIDNKQVSKGDALELAQSHKMFDYIECSAKTGENVPLIFETIVQKIMERAGII
ncbi:MAG: Rab family GTPase [Promethearchaeota archaeon]